MELLDLCPETPQGFRSRGVFYAPTVSTEAEVLAYGSTSRKFSSFNAKPGPFLQYWSTWFQPVLPVAGGRAGFPQCARKPGALQPQQEAGCRVGTRVCPCVCLRVCVTLVAPCPLMGGTGRNHYIPGENCPFLLLKGSSSLCFLG